MKMDLLNLNDVQANTISGILSGSIDPANFSDVEQWLSQCYNPPRRDEMKMCAFNQLLFGFGVEAIYGDWQNGYWGDVLCTYVNMGDSYTPTIFSHRDKGFIVACCADFSD